MVATNIDWSKERDEMSGWEFAASEQALREKFKDYELTIIDVGQPLEIDGFHGRIYGFKAKAK